MDHTSLLKIHGIVEELSAVRQTQKLYDQRVSINAFSRLGLDVSALIDSTSLSLAAKEYEKYLSPVIGRRDLLDSVLRAGRPDLSVRGLSVQDYFTQIERVHPAFAALESVKKQMDAMLVSIQDTELSAAAQADHEEREVARDAAESISKVANSESTLQGAMDQILAAIHAQKKPAIQVMLIFIFMKMLDYLISGAIGAVMGHYAPTVLGDSPQAATKAIRNVAREVVSAHELLEDYRFVSAKVLIVRQNPRALSPEIGRLSFGKPVKVLKREKDFALVVWSDKAAGVEVQGWVFSRYLSKFN